MQYFRIPTNLLNCSCCGDVLSAHTLRTTSYKDVISNGNKVNNGPSFWGKKTKCLRTPLYVLRLKLSLSLNFKIVITGCVLAIRTSLADVRSSKGAG